MKTKDSILRLSAAAFLSAAALASVAFSSCSSDDFAPDPIKDVPAENGMATVNLSFSTPTIDTRGGNGTSYEVDGNGYSPVDTDAQEDVISSLWIYFFLQDKQGNYNLYKAFDVTESTTVDGVTITKPSNITSGDSFTTVLSDFTIPQGKYHIYVIANLIDYVTTSSASIQPGSSTDWSVTESNLTDATFNTKKADNATDGSGVFSGALPMAAYYSDVTVGSNTPKTNAKRNDDGSIEILQGSATIQASMTYLCSKIRYTFFFDNTVTTENNKTTYGFSYPYQSFEYTELGLHNAMKYAAVYPDNITANTLPTGKTAKQIIDDTSDQTQGCVFSEFPEEGYDAWLGNTDTYIPAKLDARTLGEGEEMPTSGKIAYQGMIYVSENKDCTSKTIKNADGTRTEGTKTYLHLKVKLDGKAQDYVINLPDNTVGTEANYLKHGNFYDIIGKITS
ncbi:MAG: hypothetical protein K2K64_02775, partial [Muribaculaceae bacterium]|nr:hypothetical protein [Muribaculaceae bacterium]